MYYVAIFKRLCLFVMSCLFCLGLSSHKKILAAEGGSSFYVPGLYGEIGVAIPPSPGTYMLATFLHYSASAPHQLLPNGVDQRGDVDIFSQLIRGFWVAPERFLGAQFLTGFRLSVLDSDVSADVKTSSGLLLLNDNNYGLGDLGILPFSFYWQYGDIYINLYEAINVPTGKFSATRLANVALHHWAFDTVLGLTWLDPKTGIEISVTPGIIYNTKNSATNYQTGIEFHMDAMLNWHLSTSLSIGLHGSVYQQLTADKGGHSSLGSFKGRSYSIGPAVVWHKQVGNQKYYLSAKWLHEFSAKNKVEGDLTLLSLGVKF